MTRHYAEDTQIPISRSREEIVGLLRAWGADGVQWSDDYSNDKVTLRFVWTRSSKPAKETYVARFDLKLASRESLSDQALDGRTGEVSPRKMEKLLETRGKREHRVLLLWLKAALNAVELGIVDPMALFLPFFEDKNGQTVAEVAIPKLAMLTSGRADRLLGAGV